MDKEPKIIDVESEIVESSEIVYYKIKDESYLDHFVRTHSVTSFGDIKPIQLEIAQFP